VAKIKLGVTVDAPVPRVWNELEDVTRHVEWMRDAESIEPTSGRTGGLGATFVCVTRVGPLHTNDLMRVVEWEPRRVMAIRHEGAVTGTGRIELRRKRGGRTRIVWSEQLRFPWWFGGPVGAFAARPILRRIWTKNLQRLAALCAA
jgi:carbon monoxide dehydrogenase subunit G